LGLAYCVAKLDWKKAALLLAVSLGIFPYLFSGGTHGGRLMGCLVPFFVIAGLGLNEMVTRLFQDLKGRIFQRTIWVFFMGYGVWATLGVFSRVYQQWSEIPVGIVLAQHEALKDIVHGYSVFLGPDLAPGDLGLLYESHPARVLRDSNVIYAGSNGKEPDVVVYLSVNSSNLKSQLTQAFPAAPWTGIHSLKQNPTEAPVFWRCSIPFSDISNYFEKFSESRKKRFRSLKSPPPLSPIFQVRQVPAPYWERQYFNGKQGLSLGLLAGEDKVTDIASPIPPEVSQEPIAVQYKGTIHVDKNGSYELNWKAINRTKIFVDEKKVLDVSFPQFVFFPQGDTYMEPERSGKRNLSLNAGNHQVKIITIFQRSRNAPDIVLHRKGAPGDGQSLWSSFSF